MLLATRYQLREGGRVNLYSGYRVSRHQKPFLQKIQKVSKNLGFRVSSLYKHVIKWPNPRQ